MIKIIEPSVYRFTQAKYQRPLQWAQTTPCDPCSENRRTVQNQSFGTEVVASNESISNPLPSNALLGDINRADTNALKRVNGVGSVLANRIVKFRSYLGFYAHMDQLKEVYRLPDSVHLKLTKRFTLDHSEVKRLSINTATKKELMRLPYLNSEEWDIVLEERSLKGGFRHQDELTNLFVKTLNKKSFILLYLKL
ncbi:MAG: helix-hairpin-helix domain-containing protein [Flavobacteriaceae bacterium]